MDIRNILFSLCELSGPSGFERRVAEEAVEWMRPLVDKAYSDRFGNAVGVRCCGNPNARKLLLDAHLDEIGLIVTGMEKGYLRFRTIGGVDLRVLPDQELILLAQQPAFGVVACLPPHVQTDEDCNKSIPVSELFIDVGMSQEQAEKQIPIGTPAVFRSSCFSVGDTRVCGKAMDDRAGFVCLLRTLELLQDRRLDVDLVVLGSAREEVSGAGARVGAFAHAPDCCVAVDVTHAKTPDTKGSDDRVFELGGGPAIGMGPNMTRWMTARMMDKARQFHISYQTEVMSGHSGTNGWHMQTARDGIATSVISLPVKYMHSPNEVLELADIEKAAQLLAAFAENLGKEGAFEIC